MLPSQAGKLEGRFEGVEEALSEGSAIEDGREAKRVQGRRLCCNQYWSEFVQSFGQPAEQVHAKPKPLCDDELGELSPFASLPSPTTCSSLLVARPTMEASSARLLAENEALKQKLAARNEVRSLPRISFAPRTRELTWSLVAQS